MIYGLGSNIPISLGPFVNSSGVLVTTGTPTVVLYKAGGPAVSPVGSVSAVDAHGVATFTPNANDTNVSGDLLTMATLTNAMPYFRRDQITFDSTGAVRSSDANASSMRWMAIFGTPFGVTVTMAGNSVLLFPWTAAATVADYRDATGGWELSWDGQTWTLTYSSYTWTASSIDGNYAGNGPTVTVSAADSPLGQATLKDILTDTDKLNQLILTPFNVVSPVSSTGDISIAPGNSYDSTTGQLIQFSDPGTWPDMSDPSNEIKCFIAPLNQTTPIVNTIVAFSAGPPQLLTINMNTATTLKLASGNIYNYEVTANLANVGIITLITGNVTALPAITETW